MFASITSAVVFGAAGHRIDVEVHVANGLPGLTMIGLPDETVRESRDRVRAALTSSGLKWPDQRVTVNLSPSEQRKTGAGLDLAIAVGVLVATGVVEVDKVESLAFIAELGLDGSVRPVPGVAPMVGVVGDLDVVVSPPSAVEAGVAAAGRVRTVRTLRELVGVLDGDEPWTDHEPPDTSVPQRVAPDLADVLGQPHARAALEVAAIGGHHALLVGPPGSGKSMLARRLPGLLPPLPRHLSLETTMVHSAAGATLPPEGLITTPPFRAPHHGASAVSLIGGGSSCVRPGEISLAHGGVLFLDELAEFAPSVLDGLRQPLESRMATISRSNVHADIPADFLLFAAMNPCPCGGGDEPGECICAPSRAQKYAARVSGPILDRFDLRVPVSRPRVDDLISGRRGESTATVAARVAVARGRADARQGCLNSRLQRVGLDQFGPLTPCAVDVISRALERKTLTARGLDSMRRVALTIADARLAGAVEVGGRGDGTEIPLQEPDGRPRPCGDTAIHPDASWVTESDVALALELRTGLKRTAGNGVAA